jgi:ligand-binding sensor domain-containing protein
MKQKQISKPNLSIHRTLKEKCQITVILLLVMLISMAITPSHENTDSNPVQENKKISVKNRSLGKGIRTKTFYAAVVDTNNTKWFLTENGIVSFDGKKWSKHNKNLKVPTEKLKGMAYEFSSYGPELWIASPQGATVASLPVDATTGATTYNTQNTTILSDNVLSVATGKGSLRWFGTDKGISAFLGNKWLTYSGFSYKREYPESLFRNFPITCMATSPDGNLVYAGTEGGGVARVFRNEVDGISGASVHSYWGPINMPSDKVYSICITPDGTQWYGTNNGVARHTGTKTLENWTVFNTNNGLVDNFVQAIAIDITGKMWFGTKGGVSVFDGTAWTSYSIKEGLHSNNILCITSDKNGILWLGTDNGVMSYNNGEFACYR